MLFRHNLKLPKQVKQNDLKKSFCKNLSAYTKRTWTHNKVLIQRRDHWKVGIDRYMALVEDREEPRGNASLDKCSHRWWWLVLSWWPPPAGGLSILPNKWAILCEPSCNTDALIKPQLISWLIFAIIQLHATNSIKIDNT